MLAASTGSGIRIQGTLSSVPDSEFHLEFYAIAVAMNPGTVKVKYLGSGDVTTGSDGVAELSDCAARCGNWPIHLGNCHQCRRLNI